LEWIRFSGMYGLYVCFPKEAEQNEIKSSNGLTYIKTGSFQGYIKVELSTSLFTDCRVTATRPGLMIRKIAGPQKNGKCWDPWAALHLILVKRPRKVLGGATRDFLKKYL